MSVKFSNNAVSVTTTALSTTDTIIALPAGHGTKFPVLGGGDWCYLTLVDASANMEIVKATARVGDVLTVMRAQEGTTMRAFNSGTVVSHRLTAQAILDLVAGFATTTQLSGKVDVAAQINSDKITFRQRGAVVDFNKALDPGYYTYTPWEANQPPSATYGHMLVVSPGGWGDAGPGLWMQQTAHGHDGLTFTRQFVNTGWKPWRPVHTEGAVISTGGPSGGHDGQVWYQV